MSTDYDWDETGLWQGPDRTSFHDGTERVVSPEVTWNRLEPTLLDVYGMTRVSDITWLDDLGIPTAQAVRPGSLTLTAGQGKAPTWEAARISAVMETVEYWHAEEFTTDVRATANDLKDELCYDPLALTEGSVSLFHRRMTVDWVRGVSLVTGRATWLPADAARLNLRLGNTWAPPLFNMDTNGLASGNTVYEAALHGLYEIMERHCMYLADDESPRFIDPLSVDDPVLAPLFQSVLRNNECVIRDVTLWPEYPCYQVGIRSPYLISGFGGSGLHTRASVSLSRALTEAAQSRLTTISGSREDIADEEYMYLAKPLETPPLVRDEVRNLEPWISVQDEAGNFSVSEHMREAAMFIHAITGHEPVAAVLRRGPSQAAVVKVLAPGLGVEAQLNRRVPLVGERT